MEAANPTSPLAGGNRTRIHPRVVQISGLVPPDVDARAEYREHLLKKHRTSGYPVPDQRAENPR